MATVEVKCRFCNQMDYVKKHGKGAMKHQRYRCYQCNKTFQLDYIYRACRRGILLRDNTMFNGSSTN